MNVKDRLFQALNEEEVVELVRDLVRIPSHWALPERELPLARHLEEVFRKEKIEVRLQEALPNRPNVIATLPGEGGGASLALNGHTDTVPVAGMENPFAAEIRNGFMYGRGTADMKGGLGAMAYALIMLKRIGARLKGDLHFTGVIDEDSAGSEGTRHVIRNGPRTDFAIVGEPTRLEPVTAHNGIDYWKASFIGKASHSSKPENGANAIYAASRFALKIGEGLAADYARIRHPLAGRPTVNAGLIKGCAETNSPYLEGRSSSFAGVVPDRCDLYLDIRWSPLQAFAEVEATVRKLAAEAAAESPGTAAIVEYIPLPRPPMDLASDTPLFRAVGNSLGEVLGIEAKPTGVPFWTDAGLLKGLAGIPSLVLGPGDISCAHAVDERVETRQLPQAALIYACTAVDLCGPA
ncbi:MAG: M20/M25/M40 family metallo-hydrolase [Planctomycetota bacterium]|jgi:acetylornithine deacetylase/succinyl-diaminopimelate desuccinylase|nr:M20/M25/M40 family metallo-hydrolase [Planctomycetota bacterium]